MPRPVTDYRGQQDNPRPFWQSESEKQINYRYSDKHHQNLPEFNPEVKSQQRHHQVGTCELHALSQQEGESKSMNQAKSKGHYPSVLLLHADYILAGHVDD